VLGDVDDVPIERYSLSLQSFSTTNTSTTLSLLDTSCKLR